MVLGEYMREHPDYYAKMVVAYRIGDGMTREGFRPAYHMNRDNWITILLDGSVDNEEIYTFLDMSFGNVGPKAKKN
jgi:predicted DNA-binding protein (MmcQ/YjbR family)